MLLVAIYLGFIGELRFFWLRLIRLLKVVLLVELEIMFALRSCFMLIDGDRFYPTQRL